MAHRDHGHDYGRNLDQEYNLGDYDRGNFVRDVSGTLGDDFRHFSKVKFMLAELGRIWSKAFEIKPKRTFQVLIRYVTPLYTGISIA